MKSSLNNRHQARNEGIKEIYLDEGENIKLKVLQNLQQGLMGMTNK